MGPRRAGARLTPIRVLSGAAAEVYPPLLGPGPAAADGPEAVGLRAPPSLPRETTADSDGEGRARDPRRRAAGRRPGPRSDRLIKK